MTSKPAEARPLISLKLVWIIWVLFGLIFALKTYFLSRLIAYPRGFFAALLVELLQSQIYFLCTIPVLVFAERFPITPRNWAVRVPVHFVAGLVFAAVTTTLSLFVGAWQWNFWGLKGLTLLDLLRVLLGDLDEGIYVYWALIFIIHAASFYSRYRDEEARTQEFESELALSQLHSLKAQLKPHFLFNTLNAVTQLIHSDPQTAERTLINLSDLLRFSLNTEMAHEVTLEQELSFLKKYAAIQKTLREDRLEFQWDIQTDVLDARVPNLLLQPLVENSIRHGITSRPSGGSIRITAHRVADMLRIKVSDNGSGFPDSGFEDVNLGVGLSNTRARLRHLYGRNHKFEMTNESGGATVTIAIPFTTFDKDNSALLATQESVLNRC